MKDFYNWDKCLKGKVITRKEARTKGILYHQEDKGYPAILSGNDFVYGEYLELIDFENNIIDGNWRKYLNK